MVEAAFSFNCSTNTTMKKSSISSKDLHSKFNKSTQVLWAVLTMLQNVSLFDILAKETQKDYFNKGATIQKGWESLGLIFNSVLCYTEILK